MDLLDTNLDYWLNEVRSREDGAARSYVEALVEQLRRKYPNDRCCQLAAELLANLMSANPQSDITQREIQAHLRRAILGPDAKRPGAPSKSRRNRKIAWFVRMFSSGETPKFRKEVIAWVAVAHGLKEKNVKDICAKEAKRRKAKKEALAAAEKPA